MGWSPLKIQLICLIQNPSLSFRTLVRKYDCDLCTPMIIAADFVRSLKARHSEFTTNQDRQLSIPVVANGDVKSLKDVEAIHQRTGADGVMVARGLLANPALFAGYEDTPLQCVQDWVDIALSRVLSPASIII
ncbi:putative tRNA-dihydrouridine synthase protein [Naja naja]|nr:putative tRNA-dihydrouridine synthase protein [Naja naja]